jgi:hypothetical protein
MLIQLTARLFGSLALMLCLVGVALAPELAYKPQLVLDSGHACNTLCTEATCPELAVPAEALCHAELVARKAMPAALAPVAEVPKALASACGEAPVVTLEEAHTPALLVGSHPWATIGVSVHGPATCDSCQKMLDHALLPPSLGIGALAQSLWNLVNTSKASKPRPQTCIEPV